MKLLFVIDKINVGGVSSSLLNLLNYLNGKAECDLLIFSGKCYEDKLPVYVNVVDTSVMLNLLGKTQQEITGQSKGLSLFRAVLVVMSKLLGGYWARKLLFRFVKNVQGYDAVIAFTHDVSWKSFTTGCAQYVQEKSPGMKKIAFVHCDYKNYGGYNPRQDRIYKDFDYIACVSNSCVKSFNECFPRLKNKTICVENITNVERIKMGIESYKQYDHTKCNIVTVCRLTNEKGIDRTLNVVSKLKDNGITNFFWTVVGGGPDEELLKLKVERLYLKNYVCFEGEKDNPFYYVKDAAYFLLPSYHEAAPMVFGECVTLGVPIITTNTVSAKELVEQRNVGYVCENSEEGLYEILSKKISQYSEQVYKERKGINQEVNQYAIESIDRLLAIISKNNHEN